MKHRVQQIIMDVIKYLLQFDFAIGAIILPGGIGTRLLFYHFFGRHHFIIKADLYQVDTGSEV